MNPHLNKRIIFSFRIYWIRCLRILGKLFRKIIIILGLILIFMVLFSFTSGPFWIYHWLGTHDSHMKGNPKTIILLGGGGMPSESGLIRCYHASQLGLIHPEASIIIALPADTLTEESSICMMRRELMIRGIDSTLIYLEYRGRNTRGQALNCIIMGISEKEDTTILVTSPEHMLRSIKTFRKAGYKNIGGYSAFEYAIESNLEFDDEKMGGKKGITPGIGKNINLRYRFWTHLKYEILILREFSALTYYKLRGWI